MPSARPFGVGRFELALLDQEPLARLLEAIPQVVQSGLRLHERLAHADATARRSSDAWRGKGRR
jgi:hypothetical protein